MTALEIESGNQAIESVEAGDEVSLRSIYSPNVAVWHNFDVAR
jgi:hypothetical protein